MANFVDPAAIAAVVGNPSQEPRDTGAARRLRARAQRYRLLSQTLICQEAVDAAQACARELDADAARLEEDLGQTRDSRSGSRTPSPHHHNSCSLVLLSPRLPLGDELRRGLDAPIAEDVAGRVIGAMAMSLIVACNVEKLTAKVRINLSLRLLAHVRRASAAFRW